MGAEVFHGRVRDGIGCVNLAMTIGPPGRILGYALGGVCVVCWDGPPCKLRGNLQGTRARLGAACGVVFGTTLRWRGWEFDRAIRTARLHRLPGFHLRPINVLVWHGPRGRPRLEGGFLLRCLQQLSRPHLATQLCHWRDNWCTRGASIPVLSY